MCKPCTESGEHTTKNPEILLMLQIYFLADPELLETGSNDTCDGGDRSRA
jgi:hypothetical protein